MSDGKFGLTYTVRNEARLLPSAIKYHLAAGCSIVYVFFDGTTDNTEELIKGIENVFVFQTTKPANEENLPLWIVKILPWWETDMDVRKRINTYFAAKFAYENGIEWLVGIDPDELIIPSTENVSVHSNLIPEFLSKIPKKYDQVLMRNMEVIPSSAESENPFVDCRYFLNRFPNTEKVWRLSTAAIRRIFKSPRIQAWYDYWFYRVRFANALPRLMVNPVTKEKIPGSYFLGYSNHKSIIRTKFYDKYNFVTHKWIRYNGVPKNIYVGFVLHYDLFDYRYLSQKFKQRSESMLLIVFYFRYMLALVARDANMEMIKEFFLKYIAITDITRIEYLKKRKIVSQIDMVSRFFLEKKNYS